jgi:hypothetical protein
MREKKQVFPRTRSDENRPQDENKGAKPPPRDEGRPRVPPDAPASSALGRAYERFLELPVPVVLVVLWLIGAVLLGTVIVAAYSVMVWLWAALALL